MTSPNVKASAPNPTLTTHPSLGVAGVLQGATIATCTGCMRLHLIRLHLLQSVMQRNFWDCKFSSTSAVPTQYRRGIAAPVEAV
jgi:hypothetical protein